MENCHIEEPDQTRDPLDSRIPCPGCGAQEKEDCQCDPRLAVLKSLQPGDIVVLEDKSGCRNILQVGKVTDAAIHHILNLMIGCSEPNRLYSVHMDGGFSFDYLLTHTIRVLRDGEGVI